ncbi:MAG: hypothetical protein KAS39_05230 [Actinomycetia bacterium]|nr:hypothetical protein [Actinomycetes bacterium]
MNDIYWIMIGISGVILLGFVLFYTITFLMALFLADREESIDIKPPLDSAVRWYMNQVLEQLPAGHEISVFKVDNIYVIAIQKIGTRSTIYTNEAPDLGMAWRLMYNYVMNGNE